MNYADNTAIAAAWQSGTSTVESNPTVLNAISPTPAPIAGNHPTPAGGNFLSLGNSVRYRDIGTTLSDNWTFSFRLSHTTYSRTQAVYLLNAAGTEGYGLTWNSTNVNQNSGNGLVTLRRFNDTDYTSAATFDAGTALGANINAGKPALGYAVTGVDGTTPTNSSLATYDSTYQDFVNFTITWDNTTDLVTMYIEGAQKVQVTDATYSSFSRIYIEGNSNGYFDEMVVTVVPEPGSAALLTLGSLGLAPRRRRPRSSR